MTQITLSETIEAPPCNSFVKHVLEKKSKYFFKILITKVMPCKTVCVV